MKKRVYGRVQSDIKVKFFDSQGTHVGVITNLSENGVCLNTDRSVPTKSKIEILFPLQYEILRLSAKVRRSFKQSDNYDSIGLEILNSPTSYIEFVKRFKYESFQHLKKVRHEVETYYICSVCNHIVFTEAPFHCPICFASIENFEYHPSAITMPENSDNLTEIEKKHIPVIKISKNRDSSTDRYSIHVTVGEIEHDKSIEDHITFIDFYIKGSNMNKRCIGRVDLKCERFLPSVNLLLHNIDSSSIAVISNCSEHGYWMSETTVH